MMDLIFMDANNVNQHSVFLVLLILDVLHWGEKIQGGKKVE